MKIILIAGEGSLPRLLAQNAMKENYEVFAIAITKQAFHDLKGCYTNVVVKSPVKLKEMIDYVHSLNIKNAVVIGKLNKIFAISQIPFFDNLAKQYLSMMLNFEDNTFHSMLEKIFSDVNVSLLSQSYFLKNLFVKAGTFSERKLTTKEKIDLEYGINIAQKASMMEVSQTVVVKNSSVMAFEAAEGTDEAIKRGCKLAKKSAIIVKVPWEKQSEFFDLPTVGPRTIETIAKYKGSMLAIKAHQTFVIDFELTKHLANKHCIAFCAF